MRSTALIVFALISSLALLGCMSRPGGSAASDGAEPAPSWRDAAPWWLPVRPPVPFARCFGATARHIAFLSDSGRSEPGLVEVPPVRGEVTGVDPERNIVLISLGCDDCMRVGYPLTVHTRTEYVGRLTIDVLGADWAAGHMDPDLTARFPEVNDLVSSDL